MFAVLHPPAPGTARNTSVLLCPPFGWQEVSAYRPLRRWAEELAADGYPTLRISYPGTGDSGGSPRDPGRLEAWTRAVKFAAGWLRSVAGSERVAAIGLGLGGLIAYRAAAMGAELDELALWATPARGRALIRELRAFSRMEASMGLEGMDPVASLAPGELEAGGFLLSAETVRELEALDLTTLDVELAGQRRVLLLDRDGIPADRRLRETLERAGTALTLAPGEGYGAMTLHPQHASPPTTVIQCVASWLEEGSAPAPADSATAQLGSGPPLTAALESIRLPAGNGEGALETVLTPTIASGRLAAVLIEPTRASESDLCVVMLNAGTIRRIGPGRMWVEAGRRWAARGIPSLRLDVRGIGEADGDETVYRSGRGLYEPDLIAQVRATLDVLQQRGVAERFVLVGMCAGGYWAFHAALDDPRVDAAWMVNPGTLVWHRRLVTARRAAHDLRALLFEKPSWARLRSRFSLARLGTLIGWLLGAPVRRVLALRSAATRALTPDEETDALLERWQASGKHALMLFAEHEELDEELSRSGRMARMEDWPGVSVVRIAAADHTFRASWAQRAVHDVLDAALEQELAAKRSARALPTPAARPRTAE